MIMEMYKYITALKSFVDMAKSMILMSRRVNYFDFFSEE